MMVLTCELCELRSVLDSCLHVFFLFLTAWLYEPFLLPQLAECQLWCVVNMGCEAPKTHSILMCSWKDGSVITFHGNHVKTSVFMCFFMGIIHGRKSRTADNLATNFSARKSGALTKSSHVPARM